MAARRDPLLEAFEVLCRRAAERPLVVGPSRASRVGDVDGLARAVADELRGTKIGSGRAVALHAVNGPGFLAGLVAILRHRCTVLLLDRQTRPAEITAICRRFGASALVSCDEAWPAGPGAFRIRREPDVARAFGADRTGVIKLTSASTGEPRGVDTPTERLLADDEALTATMGIRPADRLLSAIPFSHSYGLSSLVVPALVRGAMLVLPEGRGPFSPLAAAHAAEATVFPTVPAYVAALSRLEQAGAGLGTLRLVLAAGARLLPETAAAFRERYGRPVHVFYGASECGGICYDREGGAAERDRVGEPVEGVSLEFERLPGAAADDPQRLVVRSAAVAAGYLPEPDPRLQDGRFISDDLALGFDREVRLVGRLDRVINVRGKKVHPLEIERVIAEHPAVQDVHVVGERRPDFDDELVRAVVARRPGTLTSEQLYGWCRERLSEFKIPRSFVLVDRLPRTERGKIERASVAAPRPPAREEP